MNTEKAPRSQAGWIKASRSGSSGNCVEMRRDGAAVQVRDSKNVDGGILTATTAQFSAWIAAARRGEFSVGR